MKIYFRYIILKLAVIFIGITILSLSLTSLLQLVRFSYLIDSGFMQLFKLILFTLPTITFGILPFIACVSVIYCYLLLIKSKEILTLQTIGLSKTRIAMPAVIFSLIVTFAHYYISLSLMPTYHTKLKNKIYDLRDNYITSFLHEKSINKINKHINIYLGKKVENSTFTNVIILDNSEESKIFVAEQGHILMENNCLILSLKKGFSQSSINNFLKFDELNLNINLNKNTKGRTTKDLSEYFISELLNSTLPKAKAELYQRILWPMYNILLIFISLKVISKKYDSNIKIKLTITLVTFSILYFIIQNLIVKHPGYIFMQLAIMIMSLFV